MVTKIKIYKDSLNKFKQEYQEFNYRHLLDAIVDDVSYTQRSIYEKDIAINPLFSGEDYHFANT
ncbi:hypothetical protein W03_18020 [Nitrosomonas sp. PY1]|nr:hypothetical protein W03_18020 [Nitrosomonas sp. PY1]